ncbi:MAG TPA: transglutaminase domain-containing protein [Thermoanaerobaculaceae bacterium]|nr:transglutaminase domain-containing protein [Thermoanaerobaculaceae bacterium]
MKPHAAVVALAVVAASCASTSVNYTYMSPQRWADEMARRGIDLRQVPNPLAVSREMQQTAELWAGIGTPPERLQRLQNALFDDTNFPFHYEHRETYTASEAFARREGNCLSFTNLFVALGRSLGLKVTTALVKRAQASEKDGDLIIVNNHVVAALSYDTEYRYYDFDRRRHDRATQIQPLDDLWITALYLNNRGADELRVGHPDIALKFFVWATELAPTFAPAWGNVGVARRRLGDIAGAFEAYSHALTVSEDDPTILGNLASLYRSLGKEQEAEMALQAIRVGNATPHTLIVRGDLELTRGHLRGAIRLYKLAAHLGPKLADPWVALARAELVRSNPARARSDVKRALHLEPGNKDALLLDRQLSGAAAPAVPN